MISNSTAMIYESDKYETCDILFPFPSMIDGVWHVIVLTQYSA
jgi:hypothetical protein